MEHAESVSKREDVIIHAAGISDIDAPAPAADTPPDPAMTLPSTSVTISDSQLDSISSNSSNSSVGHRIRSGNLRLQICFAVVQLVAAVVCWVMSRHDNPRPPLRALIVSYAAGCVTAFSVLCWDYYHRDQNSYHAGLCRCIPLKQPIGITTTSDSDIRILGNRIWRLMEYLRAGVLIFFGFWFFPTLQICNWTPSNSGASILYWLCLVLMATCCFEKAMQFILSVIVFCCVPAILVISVVKKKRRGATSETITALPVHKFIPDKNSSTTNREPKSGAEERIVAVGSDNANAI